VTWEKSSNQEKGHEKTLLPENIEKIQSFDQPFGTFLQLDHRQHPHLRDHHLGCWNIKGK
jgi:hypothetical protein